MKEGPRRREKQYELLDENVHAAYDEEGLLLSSWEDPFDYLEIRLSPRALAHLLRFIDKVSFGRGEE